MHIGIIGHGNIGKRHYQALASLDKASQIHICSSKEQAPLPKAFFHNNFDSVISKTSGVVIAAPNHVHAEYVLSLVREKRFVLCEKPLCSNEEEITELKQIENENLVNLVFNYRFLKMTEEAVHYIQKQGLQNIQKITLVFNKDSAIRKKEVTWRDSGMGGISSGAFGDLGIHLIDLMVYLCKSHPKEIQSHLTLQTRVPNIGGKDVLVDDDASFKGQLENGIHFDLLASKSCSPEEKGFSLTIETKESKFSYHSSDPCRVLIEEKGTLTYISLPPRENEDPENEVYGWADSFVSLHKAWLDKLSGVGDDSRLGTLQDGINAQEIFFTAYEKTC